MTFSAEFGIQRARTSSGALRFSSQTGADFVGAVRAFVCRLKEKQINAKASPTMSSLVQTLKLKVERGIEWIWLRVSWPGRDVFVNFVNLTSVAGRSRV